MNAAQRLKLQPVPMPEQEPAERVHNVREVPLGFTPADGSAGSRAVSSLRGPALCKRLPRGGADS